MKKRERIVVLSVVLVCAIGIGLAQAACSPQPYCETEDCLYSGRECWLPREDCSYNYLCLQKTEYERWYCPSVGYIMEESGYLCPCYKANPMDPTPC